MGSTASLRPSHTEPAIEPSATPTAAPTEQSQRSTFSPRPTRSPVTTPTPAPTASPFGIPSGWPSAGAYPPEEMPRWDTVEVSWGYLSSFEEIIEAADIFILGEVLAVGPRETSSPMAKSQSQILVTTSAKGALPAGSIVLVGQIGGIEDQTENNKDFGGSGSPAPLPPEAPPGAEPLPPRPTLPPFMLVEPDDHPIFRVGERVVLALRWSPLLGMYEGVRGPQGRFRIDAQGRVHPMDPEDPTVASLGGLTVEELLARVAAEVED